MARRLTSALARRLLLLLAWPAAVQAQFTYTADSGQITITGYDCSGVTIPGTIDGLSVTSIGDYAFAYCTNLTTVTIPNSVTNIGVAAFSYCSSLASITIPKSVPNIGTYAFSGCTSLTGVYFQGNAPSAGQDVFLNTNTATVHYFPETTGWGPIFAGRPAVLWNPQVQTTDSSFGVQAGQFGFTITGTTGLVIVVEASELLTPCGGQAGWVEGI